LEDTIEGFEKLTAGDFDELPEQAFFMVGTIDQAVERAKKLSSSPA
jgi:F-type H+-transporting ATPase subunit beta